MKSIITTSLVLLITVVFAPNASATVVGYWNFDNNYLNQQGAAGDGTLSYGTSTFSGDVSAAIGSGMSGSFDGDSAIEVANPGNVMNSTTFTLSYFIKPDTQASFLDRITARDSNSFLTAIGNANAGVGGTLEGELSYYRTTQATNDAESWFGWDKTKVQVATGDTAWVHVAWVNTGGTDMKLYINGVAQATGGSFSGDAIQDTPIGPLWLGGNDPGINTTDSYTGLLDDVLLTDDAMSQSELAFIAANGVDAFLNPVPAPAALPAGLAMIAMLATRRRR